MLLVLLIILLLLGSSVRLAGTLFHQQRLLTLVATAGMFWQGEWLLLALLDRVVTTSLATEVFYLIGSIVFCMLTVWATTGGRFNYRLAGSGWRDISVLLVLTAVGGAAIIVASVNGFQEGDYVLHGFYNGDTTTFVSLIQRYIIAPELGTQNPFAGNGYLEYPTLLHAGWGEFWRFLRVGLDWLRFLPLLTYVQILITIPLFFLLWDILWPETEATSRWAGEKNHWLIHALQVLSISFVLAVSFDNYIYPQSHFFLTAIFLGQVALLLRSYQLPPRQQEVVMIVAWVLTLVLLQANAVTGTAALICFGLASLASLKTSTYSMRAWRAVLILALVAIFFGATPGMAAFGVPHFSYTATEGIVRLTGVATLLTLGIFMYPKRDWQLPLFVVSLGAATLLTFFLSQRAIVVANASRFMYHAAVIGSPLLLLPFLRGVHFLRREYLLSSRPVVEYLATVAGLLVVAVIFFLPAAASIVGAFDHLVRQEPNRVHLLEQEAMWWLADHTPVSAVIAAPPHEPWIIPYFTGRAQLRAAHEATPFWLSRDDDVAGQLDLAYAGDRAAQASIVPQVDYLLIPTALTDNWPLPIEKKVFSNPRLTIYTIR